MRRYWVYVLCSQKNGTLYIGVTSDLARRVYEHKHGLIPGFTKRYNVNVLVYVEEHATMAHAIDREKVLKHWNRSWKIELIEASNIEWEDLSSHLLEGLI